MPDEVRDDSILLITGASLRAEEMDRPLAYRLRDEILSRLGADSPWKCHVITDVLYLNSENLHARPAISIGGPGVNGAAQYLLARLPHALAVDNVLLIQMDVKMEDNRCSIWGMDHDTMVEAIDTFIEKGYLNRFLIGVRQAL